MKEQFFHICDVIESMFDFFFRISGNSSIYYNISSLQEVVNKDKNNIPQSVIFEYTIVLHALGYIRNICYVTMLVLLAISIALILIFPSNISGYVLSMAVGYLGYCFCANNVKYINVMRGNKE